MNQKPENNHDGVPVSQAILAKTTVLSAIPKKKKKNTALSRFCQNKVILESKHTVLSSFQKKIEAIGNQTENSRVPS